MSQSDFLSLAFESEPADESPTTSGEIAVGMYLYRESAAQNEDKSQKEVYVPVNAIPDEAYALIATWEASNLTSTTFSDHMEIDEEALNPLTVYFLEPAESAPPKRYGSTFWRSVSRRILALSRAQSMEDDLQISL